MSATTKYVSVKYQSTGKIARTTPEIPPITNIERKPAAKKSGVFITIVPRQSVASQLKILMPVGTAIANEEGMKKASTTVAVGVGNMWCGDTSMLRNVSAAADATTAL